MLHSALAPGTAVVMALVSEATSEDFTAFRLLRFQQVDLSSKPPDQRSIGMADRPAGRPTSWSIARSVRRTSGQRTRKTEMVCNCNKWQTGPLARLASSIFCAVP